MQKPKKLKLNKKEYEVFKIIFENLREVLGEKNRIRAVHKTITEHCTKQNKPVIGGASIVSAIRKLTAAGLLKQIEIKQNGTKLTTAEMRTKVYEFNVDAFDKIDVVDTGVEHIFKKPKGVEQNKQTRKRRSAASSDTLPAIPSTEGNENLFFLEGAKKHRDAIKKEITDLQKKLGEMQSELETLNSNIATAEQLIVKYGK